MLRVPNEYSKLLYNSCWKSLGLNQTTNFSTYATPHFQVVIQYNTRTKHSFECFKLSFKTLTKNRIIKNMELFFCLSCLSINFKKFDPSLWKWWKCGDVIWCHTQTNLKAATDDHGPQFQQTDNVTTTSPAHEFRNEHSTAPWDLINLAQTTQDIHQRSSTVGNTNYTINQLIN